MDNSALGGDIVESSTENPSLEEDSGLIEDDGDDQSDGDLSETEEPQEPDGDETTDDSTLGNTDEGDTDSDEGTDDTENDTTSDELDTSALTEDQKAMFDKAENFCKGEYEGDTTALTTAMEDETATASVTLDAENGATLAKNVEKAYLKILTEGTASYQADGTEIYMSTELNMVDKSMKEIFGLSADAQASPELGELSDDDRQTLYNETMMFFEKLYGESTETYDTTDADSTETAGGEENAE